MHRFHLKPAVNASQDSPPTNDSERPVQRDIADPGEPSYQPKMIPCSASSVEMGSQRQKFTGDSVSGKRLDSKSNADCPIQSSPANVVLDGP